MAAVPVGNGSGRLGELLEQIRNEFNTYLQERETYEHQSKAFPSVACAEAHRLTTARRPPVQQQVQEMVLVREKVYQMEQQHINVKQK